MIVKAKKMLGLFAGACLMASPAVFANEEGGSPSQFQGPAGSQGQFQSPSQLQTPSQGQFQGQNLNAQQLQQLQKAVAVIVKVPKNQSGQEMPMQAQVKMQVSDMAQQGNTDKDIEAVWNEETVDFPVDLSQENAEVADASGMEESAVEATATRPWGWRAPFYRWGFTPRPYFYGVPNFNYYYYPRIGFNPFGYGYRYPYGYRYGYRYGYAPCAFGRC